VPTRDEEQNDKVRTAEAMASELHYDRMMEDALRGVVRTALQEVAREGLPGEHHFYLTFRTGHPGVDMPEHLKRTYPEEMTIVLQHQYWGLQVEDAAFGVTLSFNRQLERLKVPFAALTAFVDPAVKFGIQFQGTEAPAAGEAQTPPAAAAKVEPMAEPAPRAAARDPGAPAEVVTLDQFRKNK
jgi:hypothetical protein